jgi:hypothetical protein
MKTPSPQTPFETKSQKLPIDWTESEWFDVWLTLARRDYQGDPAADQKSPSWITQAVAA